MAPRNAIANISFTVDSDSEDEVGAFPTPDSNTENKAPTRKPRAKAATKEKAMPATKPTAKGRPATRRASGGSVTAAKKQNAGISKKPGTRGRKPLGEKGNSNASDTEEVDEFGDADEALPAQETVKPIKRGRPAKAKKAQEEEEQQDVEATVPAKKTHKVAEKPSTGTKAASKGRAAAAAKSRVAKKIPEPEPELEEESEVAPDAFTIPETQPEPMDIEESIEIDEVPETVPPPPRPIPRRQGRPARPPSVGQRRAGSVSDTERDPALRRKLGDLTKKLEAMTVKYDNLKEAATSGKESNFDQLKRRTDQVAKGKSATIPMCPSSWLCISTAQLIQNRSPRPCWLYAASPLP